MIIKSIVFYTQSMKRDTIAKKPGWNVGLNVTSFVSELTNKFSPKLEFALVTTLTC